MKKSKYTKELLVSAVKNSKTISDVVRKVTNSNSVHGSMVALIKAKLIGYDIDFSHFIGKGWINHKDNPRSLTMDKESFIKSYLSKNPKKRTSTASLKKYLFKFKLKENKCDECGLTNVWNKKPIVNQSVNTRFTKIGIQKFAQMNIQKQDSS